MAKAAASKSTKGAKAMESSIKNAAAKVTAFGKEAFEFSKLNAEATVESGKVAATVAQGLAQTAVATAKKNWETTTAHAKAVAAVKEPVDFFKLQSDFARTQFDAVVAEFSKATEANLKLAGEIVAPLQNRFAVVSNEFKARFAA
jgi:phasin family protein